MDITFVIFTVFDAGQLISARPSPRCFVRSRTDTHCSAGIHWLGGMYAGAPWQGPWRNGPSGEPL